MALWHRFKRGGISRATLRQYLKSVQKRLKKILRRGKRRKLLAGTCEELLEYWTCLWVFTRVPGVEPTNNAGEQEIRPAVLWRKGSFGSHSPEGSRFAERMLTVVRSLRKQGRAVLKFIVEAITAYRTGGVPPASCRTLADISRQRLGVAVGPSCTNMLFTSDTLFAVNAYLKKIRASGVPPGPCIGDNPAHPPE